MMEFESQKIVVRIRDNLIGGGLDFDSLLTKTPSQTDQIISNINWTNNADVSSSDSADHQYILSDDHISVSFVDESDEYTSEDLSTSSSSLVIKDESVHQYSDELVPEYLSDEHSWSNNNDLQTKSNDLDPVCGDQIKSEESEEDPDSSKAEDSDNLHIECARKQLVNGKLIKYWDCTDCGRQFRHHYTYLRHLPTHTNIRDFVCKLCGKAFRQLSTLSQHRVIHSQDRPFTCEVCNKDFNRISTLISHRKIHSKVKNFQCHICQKGFHQKGNLRNHIYIHSNERPYRCNLCPKGFNQMSNLVCHKQKTHCSEVAAPWQCSRCTENFTKRNLLRAHELAQHQIVETNKENEPENNQSLEVEKSFPNNEQNQISSVEPVSPICPIPTPPPPPLPQQPIPNPIIHQLPSSPAQPLAAPPVNKGIVIPAIQTDAMHTVRLNHEIPFAVLHFVQCVPLLVRVIEFQDQSLLRPANKFDFEELRSMAKTQTNKKVSVPVVAAVYQAIHPVTGATSFVVMPPKNSYKFNSDLQNLSIQDKVVSMAMCPPPAVAHNKAGKPAPKKMKNPKPTAPLVTSASAKRKTRSVPTTRKRNKPDGSTATVLQTASLPDVSFPKPVIVKDDLIVRPSSSYEVVEQEHLSDNGDITKAIQGFATGSFLSPKKSRSQVSSPLSDFASPRSTTTNSSLAESIESSEADASQAFMTLVDALQSEGHTADLDSIKDFIFSSGMFAICESPNMADLIVPS